MFVRRISGSQSLCASIQRFICICYYTTIKVELANVLLFAYPLFTMMIVGMMGDDKLIAHSTWLWPTLPGLLL